MLHNVQPLDINEGTGKKDTAEITVVCADAVSPSAISWLWPGWLARGKLHVLAGAPGTGKTSAAIALASTVTLGGRWPDGTTAEVGNVLIWSGKDDIKDTLVPRLVAAGADRSRVHFVSGITKDGKPQAFDPANDSVALSDHVALMNPKPLLLIVDPLVSAVAGDSHKNAEVRRALQPLVDLAMTRGCALLGITHFSKATGGRDPVERITGSLAFGALARVVLAAAKMSDEEGGSRILARAKSNIGTDDGGFRYDLDVCEPVPGIVTTRVLWGEAISGTARELLTSAESVLDADEHTALNDAKAFLKMMLADAPMLSKQIRRESDECGHAWATIRRAKDALGIEARRDGGLGKNGTWKWCLPLRGLKTPEQGNASILGNHEHLSEKTGATEHTDAHRPLRGSCSKFEEGKHVNGNPDDEGEDI